MHIQINVNDLILECEYIPLNSEENSKNSSISRDETNNEGLPQKNENTDSVNTKLIKFEAFDLEILPEVCLQGLEKETVDIILLSYLLAIISKLRFFQANIKQSLYSILDIFTCIT
jgi:hypothetical protein